MSQSLRKRAPLMLGCASAALALGLILGPAPAAAQGIQADGQVVFGSGGIFSVGPNQTSVFLDAPVTVIDWTPRETVQGDALTFLPQGSTAVFTSPQAPNFAVLNRILPSTNGNQVVINGSVIGQVQSAAGGPTAGGFVAFYSPTGILIGGTATFDVGRLLLTTLDPVAGSFDDFVNGGSLRLEAQQGSTARIRIEPGAQILATPENAFFAVVAADVEMLGSARINGSHAYIAGEMVNLTLSNGFFDIAIPVGTAAAGEVVTVNGNVGGPASTAGGDGHVIYALARASQDPISLLFSGNLGFDPAQTAGVVNGEIILSANYNVSGNVVDGGSQFGGVNARFDQNSELSAVRADILLEDFVATSSVMAVGTHLTQVRARTVDSSIAGTLLMVGRERAELTASNGRSLTITGDVLVSAQDYGATSSSLQSLDSINAQAGTAMIEVSDGGELTISGNAFVTADAFGGADIGSGTAGTARAGQAQVGANGGDLTIGGDLSINAQATGTTIGTIIAGAESRGGLARLFTGQNGIITVGQNVNVNAAAFGAVGDLSGPSTVSNAYGGRSLVDIFGGGTLDIGGGLVIGAPAYSFGANDTTGGALADAGEAIVTVENSGLVTVDGQLALDSQAAGGANAGGKGGQALGGVARLVTRGSGAITVGGLFTANARARGGDGVSGGDAFGGVAGANAITGTIDLNATQFPNFADASAIGGAASFGFGGNGGIGRGGSAFFQVNGEFSGAPARLTIAGDARVIADGEGGRGGASDGATIAAGTGGDGFGGNSTTPNQADASFTSGAFLLAGGDFGTLSVGGSSEVLANGTGGNGGAGSGQLPAGRGGNGLGGLAQAGLALLGGSGSTGLGSVTITGDLIVGAAGGGGEGGRAASNPDQIDGPGGNGTGGNVLVTALAGEMNAGFVFVGAVGLGGRAGGGFVGGTGTGGRAALRGGQGGTLTATEFYAEAFGSGGEATQGTGGNGLGGRTLVDVAAADVIIDGNLTLDSAGLGGFSDNGQAGNGTGGTATITVSGAGGSGSNNNNTTTTLITTFSNPPAATLNVRDNARLGAGGQGGDARGGFRGGDGRGGIASIEANAGGVITFATAQAIAAGRGGIGVEHEGGDGFGGTAELRSLGTDSRITIQANAPNDSLNLLGAGAILSADGIGAINDGGNGIGGTGTGGTIRLTAGGGGNIELPADPANDPNSFGGAIRLWARGVGGDSFGNGGIGAGGSGTGGAADIVISGAGSGIAIGETDMSVIGAGGSSGDPLAPNITGGAGVGGTQRIEITNGGTATLVNFSGDAGGTGGDGAGSGSGGNAIAGVTGTTVINSTLNIVSSLGQFSFANGGDGAIGGNAISNAGEGGGAFFVGEQAAINFTPNGSIDDGLVLRSDLIGGTGASEGGTAQGGTLRLVLTDSTVTGAPGITVGSETVGGQGAARGGAARGDRVELTIEGTPIAGGALSATYRVLGGAAAGANGVGGDATGGAVRVGITSSTLDVVGSTEIGSFAIGGDGGLGSGGRGGNASSGTVGVTLTGSSLTVAGVQTPTGNLRIASQATSGLGETVGTATSNASLLTLAGSRVVAGQVAVTAGAAANVGRGALARAGTATIDISGASTLTADSLFINAIGNTSEGQTSIGGAASLFIRPGSTASVNAAGLFVEAVGLSEGTQPSPNVIGQFVIDVQGGNLNLGRLSATGGANGLPVSDNVPASQLVAAGGNINVTGELFVSAGGDLVVRSGAGGIIGSAATAGTTTAVSLFVDGTIDVRGDGGTSGGIGGQSVLMEAGRSLLIDSNVSTRDGPVTLTANIGRLRAETQPPLSVVTMGPGGRIDAGTGTVRIRLRDGAGNPQRATGAITLGRITGGRIDVRNLGTSAGSNIGVRADGVLTASGTGRAIDLASLSGEVINLAGDAGLVLTGGGHYGIFASTPTGSQIGSFANYARRYNVANAAAYDQLNPGGNFAAFRIAPVLTITAADATRVYGNANPALGLSVAGFLPGDGLGDLSGAAQLSTLATAASNVGTFAIDVALGTLTSVQGYQLALGNPGVLTITPRPISVTTDNLTRVYGNANPALTFAVGGQGLVNGDRLTGALATTADQTTGVGNVAITQGTLAATANYALTFAPGVLAITPRPVTVTANNLTRVYGNANPALTFAVGGQGLVNGDALTGALATTAGLTTGVGNVPITQGTLAASANYALTFAPGALAITPRPLTLAADNLAKLLGLPDPPLTFTLGGDGLVNGDQLTGGLVRDPGEAVGSFAIRQGTLSAGANYAITFTGGALTINAVIVQPAPTELTSAILFEPPLMIGAAPPTLPGVADLRFGIDFPDQSEAPLIAEDPLLDEPVTSGGDASLYGGGSGDVPPAGGQ